MPKDATTHRGDGAAITRTPFATIPVPLLEEAIQQASHGKAIVVVYLWLWHHAGLADRAYPSIATLAAKCRIKPADVRASCRWLEETGWIRRIERPGTTDLFHVRSEDPSPPPNGSLPKWGSTPNGAGHPSPKRVTTTPPPNGGGEQEAFEQEGNQQEKTPPTSLRSVRPPQGARAPDGSDQQPPAQAQQPDPQQPDPQPTTLAKQPAPRRRKPRPSPDESLVELPVFAEPERPLLAAWWRLRCAKHPGQPRDGLTRLSADALAYANQLGVLHHFCLQAAERPWVSLGFNGYRGHIERLAADVAGHAESDTLSPYNSNRARPTNKAQEGLRDFLAVYGTHAVYGTQTVEVQCSPQTPSDQFSLT